MSTSWEQSRAAERLRAAGQLEVQAPPPLARVRSEAGRRARRAAAVMAFAMALPLGAAAAAGGYAWKVSASHPLPRGGEGAVRVRKSVTAPKPVEVVVAPPPVAPVALVAPSVPAISPPKPVAPKPVAPKLVAQRFVPAPTAPLPPAPSPAGERERSTSLADESRALTAALTALRVQHDAARALELLAAYREKFPAGALRHEASIATVEAHHALGHMTEAREEALRLLEQLPESARARDLLEKLK